MTTRIRIALASFVLVLLHSALALAAAADGGFVDPGFRIALLGLGSVACAFGGGAFRRYSDASHWSHTTGGAVLISIVLGVLNGLGQLLASGHVNASALVGVFAGALAASAGLWNPSAGGAAARDVAAMRVAAALLVGLLGAGALLPACNAATQAAAGSVLLNPSGCAVADVLQVIADVATAAGQPGATAQSVTQLVASKDTGALVGCAVVDGIAIGTAAQNPPAPGSAVDPQTVRALKLAARTGVTQDNAAMVRAAFEYARDHASAL